MRALVVVGEDDLTCALGERLVDYCLPGWTLAMAPINKLGVTNLKASIPRLAKQAEFVQPVLCVADSDGACPKELLAEWRLGRSAKEENLILRFAVCAADAWALADRGAFSLAFGVAASEVPRDPDALPDPKREVLRLAARSSKRSIRTEVPSARDVTKQGSGYNLHLCSFVRRSWRLEKALENSRSLQRAVAAVERLGESWRASR